MEELKMELMNIVAQIEKEQLEARIKEELSSVGKKRLMEACRAMHRSRNGNKTIRTCKGLKAPRRETTA